MKAYPSRFVELDLLRLVAICLMVTYHAAYDLQIFYSWQLDSFSGAWWLVARASANLFLLLVGVSFVLSSRAKTPSQIWKRALQRGVTVLGIAILISIGTYLYDPSTYIRFGILHCIGISLMLLPLFRELDELSAALFGLLVISAGLHLSNEYTSVSYLLPFGLRYPEFHSIDYFPLFPWFGVVMLGTALGQWLAENMHLLHTYDQRNRYSKLLWPGRHALLVYLLHQPILLTILWGIYQI